MGQALELIPVPAIRPPGVTPRQWRHALLLPNAVSGYEAAIKAGYAPISAEKAARRLAVSLGFQRATAAIEEAKRDSDRSIRDASAKLIKNRLPSMRDETVIMAYKASSDAVAAGVEDDSAGVSDLERQAAFEYVSAIVSLATEALIRKCGLHNLDASSALSPEDVASIVLAAQTPKLTQCTLSDAGPPTPTEAPRTIEARQVR